MDINKEEIEKIRNELKTEYASASRASSINALLIVISIVIPFLSLAAFQGSNRTNSSASFIMPVLLSFILISAIRFMYVTPKIKKYKSSVKKAINSLVFDKMFENVSFNPERGFDEEALKKIAVVPFGNRYNSNDLLKGRKNGVDFERSDVWTYTETTDGDGHTTTSTDFKGQIYKFDFHKETLNYVQIKDKKFLSGIFKGHKLANVKKITLEDYEFNDKFDVYTDDEEEAFYVFTPHFMNRVMSLKNKFKSRLSIVVSKGLIYIAVNTGEDAFEIKNNQEVSDEFIKMVITEANIISEIICDLDLDSDLFKSRN